MSYKHNLQSFQLTIIKERKEQNKNNAKKTIYARQTYAKEK